MLSAGFLVLQTTNYKLQTISVNIQIILPTYLSFYKFYFVQLPIVLFIGSSFKLTIPLILRR
jgi:hypothetical protein